MTRASILLMIGACVVGFGLVGTSGQETRLDKTKPEDEFVIEKFDFDWIVVESGEGQLIVNKTHETTRITLREGGMMGDSLWLLPTDAETIGKALVDVDKYFAKMRNAKQDVQESIDAGNYNVTFSFSEKIGFRVYVMSKEQFSMSSLSLDRSQAKAFSPHLQKAKAMAAFLERKIKF
jgi:hypothetical protein